MEKMVILFRIIFILTLYSLATGVVDNHELNSTYSDQHAGQKEHYSSTVSTNLFHATSHSGSLATPISIASTTISDTFEDASAIVKLTEQLFLNGFIQYTFDWRNFLIKIRKTDLIFPFNYFW